MCLSDSVVCGELLHPIAERFQAEVEPDPVLSGLDIPANDSVRFAGDA
jgi:hypothetical protein